MSCRNSSSVAQFSSLGTSMHFIKFYHINVWGVHNEMDSYGVLIIYLAELIRCAPPRPYCHQKSGYAHWVDLLWRINIVCIAIIFSLLVCFWHNSLKWKCTKKAIRALAIAITSLLMTSYSLPPLISDILECIDLAIKLGCIWYI